MAVSAKEERGGKCTFQTTLKPAGHETIPVHNFSAYFRPKLIVLTGHFGLRFWMQLT
jgi:hypothetical protein